VTCAVPPSPFESAGTVVLPGIVVIILSAELCSLFRQRFAKFTVYTRVDYPKFEELSPNDEVINSDLSFVPIPVLHLNEQLLGAAQGHIIPVGQAYPVVLIWISKAFSVVLPSPEEVICWFAEIASPLQHRPAAPMCVHVAVDIDRFASEGDRVSAARCLPKSKLVGARRGWLFL